MFNIDGKEINYKNPLSHTVTFNKNIECKFTTYWLYSMVPGDYFYYHYIPLDVDEIKCLN